MTTALLTLDALPPKVGVGAIVRFVCDTAGVDSQRLGKVDLAGRRATVEVPAEWAARLVRLLDGARFNESNVRARCDVPSDGGPKPVRPGSEDHFARLARLLRLESEAAAEKAREDAARRTGEAAERTGESLVGLVVRDEETGLGGRALVTLGKRDVNRRLPWTRLGVGSPVVLSEEGAKAALGWRGVIADRSANTIQVALADFPELSDDRATLRLDASVDEIARQRQLDALSRATAARGERLAELVRVLLGERSPKFRDATRIETAERAATSLLNDSQREAVRLALAAGDVAIIHGPPGTGKTTTVAELIRQAVARGEKVLACAPSNLAVDNVLERLLALNVRAVRLGHPARVLPELRAHTLDLLVDEHEDVRLARKLVQQSRKLFDKAGKYTRAKPAPGARREMRDEAKALLADARRLEAQTVEQILDGADVLCATLTGIDSEVVGRRRFDLAVIDEACQTVEPACWIPLLRAERVVLAGDHCQLPPTIVSVEAAREGFGVSLLERMVAMHGATITRRLDVQYRMHASIADFSSAEFYDGTLAAHDSVVGHLLADLPGVESCELTTTPVEFIDTAGAGYDETQEDEGASRLNREEAELVAKRVAALRSARVAARDIAVISPYAAQVRLLRDRIDAAIEAGDAIEIDTVDGFQGREKEAVVISLVRSNATGDIGFLADTRRMNVALTRARRKLIVIGDSATIGGQAFYGRFLEHVERIGAYRTVWEEC
ncbi:MAG: DNA-binding protein [Planctomycetota bacterium]|nr:MAG: DNA-binding protein [Planctomycetota bacterium]